MRKKIWLMMIAFAAAAGGLRSQTDKDAIMMNRLQFCNGFVYGYSSWDHYWEGTRKRTNLNLGTVSMQSVMYMGAYGITDDINVLAELPYIWTKATAGTLKGQNGIQDISVQVKWRAIRKNFGKNKLSGFIIGGFSTPANDYLPDYLPLALGLGSTNLTGRAMIDYQRGRWNLTGSAAYIRRSNIEIDKPDYYTDRLHLTDEVEMPDATQYQLRAGFRGRYFLAEALLTRWTTLGGFDITRNNMPFPSNKMNETSTGVALKYTLPSFVNLSFVGGGNYTIKGRNVGQSTSFNVGAFYAFYFSKNKRQSL